MEVGNSNLRQGQGTVFDPYNYHAQLLVSINYEQLFRKRTYVQVTLWHNDRGIGLGLRSAVLGEPSARKQPRGVIVQYLALHLVPNPQSVEFLNVAFDLRYAGTRPIRAPQYLVGNF